MKKVLKAETTSEKTGEAGNTILNVDALDALEWARDFMKNYERKHKIVF